jgi:hypothetical protein
VTFHAWPNCQCALRRLGALGGARGRFANVLHAGGVVGSPGPGRMVPALAFDGGPDARWRSAWQNLHARESLRKIAHLPPQPTGRL